MCKIWWTVVALDHTSGINHKIYIMWWQKYKKKQKTATNINELYYTKGNLFTGIHK